MGIVSDSPNHPVRRKPYERFQSHHDPSLLGFYMALANVTAGLIGLMLHLLFRVPGPALPLFMSCAMAAGIGFQSARLKDRFKTICWIAGTIGMMGAALLFLGEYHVLTLIGIFFCVWFAVRRPKYRLAGFMALFPAIFILGIPPDWHTGVNVLIQQIIVVPVAWFTIAMLLWLPGRFRIRRALALYASSLAGAFEHLRKNNDEGRHAAQFVPMDFMLMVDRLICEREYDFASTRYYAAASVHVIQTFHSLARVASLMARHSTPSLPKDEWLHWIEARLDHVAKCLHKNKPITVFDNSPAPSIEAMTDDLQLRKLIQIAHHELSKLDGYDLAQQAAEHSKAKSNTKLNEQFIPRHDEPIILSYKRAYSLPEEYAFYDATKVAIVITISVFLFQFLRWPYGAFIPLTPVVVYIGAFLNGSIMHRVSDRMQGVIWGTPLAVVFLATACYVNYYFIYLIPVFWFLFMYSIPLLKSFCWSTAILSVYIFCKIIIVSGSYEDLSLVNLNLGFFWSTALGLFMVVVGEFILWPHLWKIDTHMFPLVRPIVADLRKTANLIGDIFLEGRTEDPDLWPALSYILNKLSLSRMVIENLPRQESRSAEIEHHCHQSLDLLFESFHIIRAMSLLCQYNDHPPKGSEAEYLKSLFQTIDYRLTQLIVEEDNENSLSLPDTPIPTVKSRPPFDETSISAELADRAEELITVINSATQSIQTLAKVGLHVPSMRRLEHVSS